MRLTSTRLLRDASLWNAKLLCYTISIHFYVCQIWLDHRQMVTLIPPRGGPRASRSCWVRAHVCFFFFVYIVFMSDWGFLGPGWCKPVLIQRGHCRLCSLPFGAAPELRRPRLCDLCHCWCVVNLNLCVVFFCFFFYSRIKKKKGGWARERSDSFFFSFLAPHFSL